jgi:hypothetical protein
MKEALGKLSIIIFLSIGLSGCTAGGGPGEVVTYGGLILLQGGTPLEGVEVTFFWPNPPNVDSDGKWIVLTDEDGWYSEWHTTLWRDRDFTITPFHTDYQFIPNSYSFEGSYGDNLDLNFTAIPN